MNVYTAVRRTSHATLKSGRLPRIPRSRDTVQLRAQAAGSLPLPQQWTHSRPLPLGPHEPGPHRVVMQAHHAGRFGGSCRTESSTSWLAPPHCAYHLHPHRGRIAVPRWVCWISGPPAGETRNGGAHAAPTSCWTLAPSPPPPGAALPASPGFLAHANRGSPHIE